LQVTREQIFADLEHPSISGSDKDRVSRLVTVHGNAYDAAADCHALVICTEWEEFKLLDYAKIHKTMEMPAFVFDGRRILDHEALIGLGFHVETIGKRLQEKNGKNGINGH
jgi:UDPglucose 6-dehydrogenase